MAKMVVSGGTGLVGSRLIPRLLEAGHRVRVPTRNPGRARLPDGVEAFAWDGTRIHTDDLAGAEAVVHLAGEPIFGGLLNARKRARISESRIDSTQSLVQAIATLPADQRPGVLVCASAVGYYPSSGDRELVERDAPGSGFLAEVCRKWEAAAASAEPLGVRRVSLRIGIVLANEGGALGAMRIPFSLGLGGRLGDGRQWMPWIHVDDLVALIAEACEDPRYTGPINACAPEPVRNAELTKTLAAVLRRPAFLPVPAFVLRAVLGELATELLGSRRVLPERALSNGFAFRYEELEPALRALLRPDETASEG